MRTRSNRFSRGYSLSEMLVVISIIGAMSLVSVPAFMKFYWSNKMKTSLRQFTTSVRAARQRAITENHPTMVSFDIGSGKRTFRAYDGRVQADGTINWTPIGGPEGPDRNMDDIVYFGTPADCTFADVVNATPGWNDVVFLSNGTIQNIPAAPCSAGKVALQTNYKIPRPLITLEMYSTGRIKAN